MAKKSNEVIKRPSAALEELPDWVKEGNEGFEGGNADDLILPRLAICQSLSPQRKKGDPLYIDGIEEGDIFNTVTGDIYEPPVRVTPVLLRKQRIKFAEKPGDPPVCMGRAQLGVGTEGIACALNNGGPCKFPGFEKNDCKLVMNFPVIIHDAPGDPIVLSLKSSGISVGKKWFTEMKVWKVQGRSIPMYAQQFDLEAIERKFQKGQAFQYKITRVKGFAPDNVGRAALASYQALKDVAFAAHQEESSGGGEREPGEEVEM